MHAPPTLPAPTPRRLVQRALPALPLVVARLRRFARRGVLVLAALLWTGAGSVSAQATLPGFPAWACGPEPSPLVCYAEGLEAVPAVTVEGGRGGLANCEDDGGGVTLRCVLWAQGDWTRVEADGVVVAERCPCTTWLGMVGR